MKHLMGMLLLLAGSAMAADDIKLVVGEGSSRTCIAPREIARQYATNDAIQHAYELCAQSGDDWNTTGHYELPGNEKKGNPRDVVQCTPCKTEGAKPADGFKCTVRMLPQTCVRPAAGQNVGGTFVSNADWAAKDRTSVPAKSGDAGFCVQVGTGANAQFLMNICREKIVVFWCLNADGARNKNMVCGTGAEPYFKKVTVLMPGLPDNDPSSHPLNVIMEYGACFGDTNSYQYMDGNGAYLCKPPIAATGPTAIMTSTARASSADGTCQ